MSAPTAIDAIARDLATHPPFKQLSEAELQALAAHVRLRYADEGEVLFEQGAPTGDVFYVMKKGMVELLRREDVPSAGQPVPWVLIGRCDQGDLFGVRPLLAQGPYSARAVAVEDSLLFVVPWAAFQAVMTVPAVATFLAAGFAAELPRRFERLLSASADARRASLTHHGGARRGTAGAAEGDERGLLRDNENDFRVVEPVRDVVACVATTSIREVARRMAEHNIGSMVVVDEQRCPVGIVTNSDLRTRVLAAGVDPDHTKVGQIMATPVQTVPEGLSVSELIGRVLRQRLHHFVVTEDGTPQAPVTGVVSEHDILTTQGSHPTVLLNQILRLKDPARLRAVRDKADVLLRSYLEQEVSIEFVANMVTEINDALIRQAVLGALRELDGRYGRRPSAPFCWLSLGSEGRREQLLRTDQDNAIVYGDPAPEEEAFTREFYLALGQLVVERLVAYGFAPCPGDMMASNPKWCQSVGAWKQTFERWIQVPEPKSVMHTNIFFDLRGEQGQPFAPELVIELRDHIFGCLATDRTFLTLFAAGAIRHPAPLGFFRNFVVEGSGKHEDQFDIKARAMMPLSDAARVLCYELRLPVDGGTFARYRALQRALPERAELFEEAAMAYGILMRFRAREGLREGSSGRYVDIRRLNKLERQTIRNTFNVVQELQRFLRVRYQLDRLP